MVPYDEVLHKYKHGTLHSGSKRGPKVRSRAQAIAIMLSEKRKAGHSSEYRASGGHAMKRHKYGSKY